MHTNDIDDAIWFHDQCARLKGTFDPTNVTCCIDPMPDNTCLTTISMPPSWVKSMDIALSSHRRLIKGIAIGITLSLFLYFILINYNWLLFNIFFTMLTIVVILLYGQPIYKKFWIVWIAMACILFRILLPQIWIWMTDGEYVWTQQFNFVSHFVVGWVWIHMLSLIFPRHTSKFLLLSIAMGFEFIYEIVEYYCFYLIDEIYNLEWTFEDAIQDVVMNLIGGLFGIGIEKYFEIKHREFVQ